MNPLIVGLGGPKFRGKLKRVKSVARPRGVVIRVALGARRGSPARRRCVSRCPCPSKGARGTFVQCIHATSQRGGQVTNDFSLGDLLCPNRRRGARRLSVQGRGVQCPATPFSSKRQKLNGASWMRLQQPCGVQVTGLAGRCVHSCWRLSNVWFSKKGSKSCFSSPRWGNKGVSDWLDGLSW